MYYLEYVVSQDHECMSYCRSFENLSQCILYYEKLKEVYKRCKEKKELVYIKILMIQNFVEVLKEDF